MKPYSDRSQSVTRMLLLIVLVFSGAGALINQIVWIRKFGLVFGVDVYTMGTVLSAFMAGLALGSLVFGRCVDKVKNPLKLFIALEVGIGIFAVLFPVTFKWLVQGYIKVFEYYGISAGQEQFIKFAFSFIYLLIPTTLMGGTLPVIIRFFVRKLNNLGWNISNLYSLNNLGAVLGCATAGFFLIRYLGVTATLYTGAALNIINSFIVWRVSRNTVFEDIKEIPVITNETDQIKSNIPPLLLRIVLWVFLIEGFATLAYEIIWARIFIGYSCDKTTYFSSVIILSFIFGLSLGSIIIRNKIDKIRNLVGLLALIEILIGLSSFGLMLLFSKHSLSLNLKRSIFDSWLNTMGKDYLVFFLILLVPTTLTGLVYPIISKLYADNMKHLGKKMGTIGFMDTGGSILGSFAAGFLLIPSIGVINSFLIIVFLNISLGLLLVIVNPKVRSRYKLITISATLAVSVLMILNVPDKQYSSWWDRNRVEIWKNFVQNVPFYEEGPDATVTIRDYGDYFALNVNGHNTAYTSLRDQIVNRMLGYIPYMLHENPKRAMVIGFGLGFTVQSLVQPEIDTIDVAEISQGVIKSGHLWNAWNNNVIDHPKVNMNLEDGRGFILKTVSTYDIITSNSIHPRLSNNIYTQDFYELCSRKLRKGGIFCQWATPNWINEKEFKAQLKAFINAFEFAQLWYLNEYSTLLVGSDQPFEINYDKVSRKFNDPKVTNDLKNINMTEPYMFTAQYSMDKSQLLEYCGYAPANTDDFPIVEFSTTVNIAPDTSALKFIADHVVDYSCIRFEQTSDTVTCNNLKRKMESISEMRRLTILDVIEDVRRQSRAYKINKTIQ